jgi:FMN phosphatase YigB (HAD superfamily)
MPMCNRRCGAWLRGLSPWFAGGVNAKQAGVGKPHPDIFMKACAALRLPAQQVLHVGDDLDLDVAGALGAGLHAVWVCRQDTAHAARPAPDGVAKLADLAALADWLGC